MSVKACLFDFDGTIANSMRIWLALQEDFFKRYNVGPADDFLRTLAHRGHEEGAKIFIERFGLNVTAEHLVNEWNDFCVARYGTDVQLKPFAYEYMQQLKNQGVKIAVTTAQKREPVDAALENLGLKDFFDFTLVCDECTTTGKQTPVVYETAARAVGVDIADSVVFEDNDAPARVAKADGFRVVGVLDESPSQNTQALREAVDRFIESYEELIGIEPDELFA